MQVQLGRGRGYGHEEDAQAAVSRRGSLARGGPGAPDGALDGPSGPGGMQARADGSVHQREHSHEDVQEQLDKQVNGKEDECTFGNAHGYRSSAGHSLEDLKVLVQQVLNIVLDADGAGVGDIHMVDGLIAGFAGTTDGTVRRGLVALILADANVMADIEVIHRSHEETGAGATRRAGARGRRGGR